MAEKHQEADVKAQDRISRANLIVPILGQVFTLIISLSGIAAGVFLVLKGYDAGAVSAIICSICPIIVAALKNFKTK